ncbi:MBL fold metallo-hydrolase [Roseateles saccharophilus]|uniref:Phosphoribosyl 1,2-cyclic phosphodiesterase n=1 Tax=Roseateles saccharophilus TaxID=304 RepID=A0A4R3VHH6_ROSSA|nr:MBL fold metallo-hydrolase [Roseateles saccharophilus]MDG0834526.1 MBL fold metallo-hydrolase [Roseateles saccharophilus]TCV03781.1 phosphoribosyl 1,2-cyclic phosphodiesterase [Roseateles saccharophilus]
MRFCSLGSGSAGNATLIEASQGITSTRLLVDAGFSMRELTRRLARAGCEPAELDAVFITHEHGDHIGCALAFASRHRLPLIMSRGTWRAVGNADFDPALLRIAKGAEAIALGDLEVRPFAVPHDAQEPLQLTLHDGAARLGIVTDLGSAPDDVAGALAGCQALLLECNHDVALLRDGPYPPSLKKRILGSHGHLSNAAAADLLARCQHPALRDVVAAHLSERNNSPALARDALAAALGCAPADVRVADPALGFDWLQLH